MPRSQNEHIAAGKRVAESRRHPTRRAILVEYRDEVAARLMADFSTRDRETERVSWPRQLARLRVCRNATLIVINGDQPFEGGWLFPCKLRVACPEAHIWLYRAELRREDGLAQTICPVDEMIAYGGDLLYLSQEMGERIAGLEKQQEVDAMDAGDGCLRQAG